MKTKKLLLILSGGLLPLIFILYPVVMTTVSCVPPQEHRMQPPDFGDVYSFPKFNIPEEKKPGSINLTAIVVVPEYKLSGEREYTSGAVAKTVGPMSSDMVKVFKSFANSIGEDISAILVAKGMTTKGPYILDEITFPDKKGADLTVIPNVIFDINYSKATPIRTAVYYDGNYISIYNAKMIIGTKIYYNMNEPLSNESMWIKKLDMGVQEVPFEFAYKQERYVYGHDSCSGQPLYSWRPTEDYAYDGRVRAFSDVLKSAYPQIMKSAWKYFDTEEMLTLKQTALDIRERKRY